MNWSTRYSHDKSKGSKYPPSYPNEMLIKNLSSTYYSELIQKLPLNAKVLELGIFSGNNARFFLDNKYNLVGQEINQEMIDLCKANLSRLGYSPPELRIGHNTNIAGDDMEFDLLIAINTLHYSSGPDNEKAIREYARVIKSDGFAVIETAGVKHFAVSASERIGNLEYVWKAGGFREDQIFGFYDSPKHFRECLLREFKKVDMCLRLEEFANVTLEFYQAICYR